MQFLKAKRQEKTCTGRYSKWFWNQNGDYLLNLYESKNLEKHKSYLLYKYRLARTLFPVESTNNKN